MRDARIGYHPHVNLPGLLLRWMLLVALVLNAPALALAATSYSGAASQDQCTAPHPAAMAAAGCCDDADPAACQGGECECPPACLGMLATLNGTPASPWREAPAPASTPQHAPPPTPDPMRPPIV
ncbi:hypothetical protein [Stenotrophomonas maltophilia]|uniref:hypothetical protein n=1 Tax=Stenotrophomonas maltophilia TaxID=40324 RepID=UPI0021AC2F6F|nr:hypothetical protein [Stenotrophomonas maltophilia]